MGLSSIVPSPLIGRPEVGSRIGGMQKPCESSIGYSSKGLHVRGERMMLWIAEELPSCRSS